MLSAVKAWMSHRKLLPQPLEGHKRVAAFACLVYIIAGVLWITVSDRLLSMMVTDQESLTLLQTYKGWIYVLFTGLLVFGLMSRHGGKLLNAYRESDRFRRNFQELFEHAPDAIMIHDLEGRFLAANQVACQRLGYSVDELTDMTPDDIESSEYRAVVAMRLQKVQQHGTAVFESAHVTRDGTRIPVEISARMTEFLGHPAILSHVRDISERKRQEQQLRLTQYSIDHAVEAAFWFDPDGRCVYVNDTACEHLGYSRQELLSKSVRDLHSGYTADRWKTAWENLKKRKSVTVESVHCRRDGSLVPVEISANYVVFEGEEYNCSFARDITERKQAEKEQERLQDRLDRAERMESLGILAGGVAHDLNNMLGPLVGYPDLILQQLPDDSPIRKHVERISNSATEAADVIQDLLTLARRGRYDMEQTDINRVIEGFLDSPAYSRLSQSYPEVDVRVDLDPDIGQITGSGPHLSKVIMNLIVNAFDAINERGELHVRTEQTTSDEMSSEFPRTHDGDYVVVRVQDTGQGIAEEDLPKIFEPYYSKKKMGRSGSGLGLSVVYGIVKDHHGFYDVVSEVGEGTEFILYFPVTPDSDETVNDTPETGGGRESILVVDDSSEQRELAADLLSSLGYLVHTATNGHDALAFLEESAVELVVLDMIMESDFDGLDTYRRIIARYPKQKCVIVSGYAATQRVTEMQRLGAGPYVRKPYTRDGLGRVVREVLDDVHETNPSV